MFPAALLLCWLCHPSPSVATGIVVDCGLRANVEAVAGGVRARKQRRKAARLSWWMKRRTRTVCGPAKGAKVRGWQAGGGRRLAKAATGATGGRQDREHAGHGPGNARRDSATWGGTEGWDCGVGTQGDKDRRVMQGSPGEYVERGLRVQDTSLIAGETRDGRAWGDQGSRRGTIVVARGGRSCGGDR